MDRLHRFLLDGINSINSCKQGLGILQHVLGIRFYNLLECFKVTFSHGLDDEFTIFTKKEKAPAFTLRLTCFEDSIAVATRQKAYL